MYRMAILIFAMATQLDGSIGAHIYAGSFFICQFPPMPIIRSNNVAKVQGWRIDNGTDYLWVRNDQWLGPGKRIGTSGQRFQTGFHMFLGTQIPSNAGTTIPAATAFDPFHKSIYLTTLANSQPYFIVIHHNLNSHKVWVDMYKNGLRHDQHITIDGQNIRMRDGFTIRANHSFMYHECESSSLLDLTGTKIDTAAPALVMAGDCGYKYGTNLQRSHVTFETVTYVRYYGFQFVTIPAPDFTGSHDVFLFTLEENNRYKFSTESYVTPQKIPIAVKQKTKITIRKGYAYFESDKKMAVTILATFHSSGVLKGIEASEAIPYHQFTFSYRIRLITNTRFTAIAVVERRNQLLVNDANIAVAEVTAVIAHGPMNMIAVDLPVIYPITSSDGDTVDYYLKTRPTTKFGVYIAVRDGENGKFSALLPFYEKKIETDSKHWVIPVKHRGCKRVRNYTLPTVANDTCNDEYVEKVHKLSSCKNARIRTFPMDGIDNNCDGRIDDEVDFSDPDAVTWTGWASLTFCHEATSMKFAKRHCISCRTSKPCPQPFEVNTGEQCEDPKSSCSKNTYGVICKKCSDGCKNGECDSITGICECRTGYVGRRCDLQPCSNGYFGTGCTQRCSEGCVRRMCCSLNGDCFHGCTAGYAGTKCNQACPSGSYGEACAQKCPEHCKDRTCSATVGHCTVGCEAGFIGQTCTEKCPMGTYGENCVLPCSANCKAGVCDGVTGRCVQGCNPGYKGSNCRQHCPHGYYGQNCQTPCNPKCVDNDCHVDYGGCKKGCKPGFTGPSCTACSQGKYGHQCSKSCADNCLGGMCDAVDGSCIVGCADGYIGGDKCQEPCETGKYGPGCERECSAQCKDRDCEHINGRCTHGCVPGYGGFTCITVCENTRYGPNCAQECSLGCINGICDRITGICTEGCLMGFSGPKCLSDQTCPVGTYGSNCELSCGNCRNNLCDSQSGNCSVGCNIGFMGSNCEQECRSGVWGDGCIDPCPEKCEACLPRTGECISRCPSGFWGKQCAGKCPENCNPPECDRNNGNCMACLPGWMFGPNSLCNVACVKGLWGDQCSKPCSENCLGGECEKETGYCKVCKAGWDIDSDKYCQKPCYQSAGINCTVLCPEHCMNRACDPLTGTCFECEPGWQMGLSQKCFSRCPNTRWGPQCKKECPDNCNEGCELLRGNCVVCKPGWKLGPDRKCKIPCGNGFWGVNCENWCPENCLNNTCYIQDGVCPACKDGWSRGTNLKCDTKSGGSWLLWLVAAGVILSLLIMLFSAWIASNPRFRKATTSTNDDETEIASGVASSEFTVATVSRMESSVDTGLPEQGTLVSMGASTGLSGSEPTNDMQSMYSYADRKYN